MIDEATVHCWGNIGSIFDVPNSLSHSCHFHTCSTASTEIVVDGAQKKGISVQYIAYVAYSIRREKSACTAHCAVCGCKGHDYDACLLPNKSIPG